MLVRGGAYGKRLRRVRAFLLPHHETAFSRRCRGNFRPASKPVPLAAAERDQSEQVIRHLKQEIEHLNTLLLSKDSHIDSLKQAMLLLENHRQN